jgi:hypothetical protein
VHLSKADSELVQYHRSESHTNGRLEPGRGPTTCLAETMASAELKESMRGGTHDRERKIMRILLTTRQNARLGHHGCAARFAGHTTQDEKLSTRPRFSELCWHLQWLVCSIIPTGLRARLSMKAVARDDESCTETERGVILN